MYTYVNIHAIKNGRSSVPKDSAGEGEPNESTVFNTGLGKGACDYDDSPVRVLNNAFSTKEYCERSFSKYDPAVNSRRAVNSAKFVFKYV